MNIIIFGPPLAGKGTQSKRILSDFGLIHLSTGDVLRSEKEMKTELGLQASEFSNKGLLAPDQLVSKVVDKFYDKNKNSRGILFDGYPRNVSQVKHLINTLKQEGEVIHQVLFLKVDQNELLKRAEERAQLEGREDDKDSGIVINRIKEFEKFTVPAIDYIKNLGVKTLEIDGDKSIDEVHQKIKSQLEKI